MNNMADQFEQVEVVWMHKMADQVEHAGIMLDMNLIMDLVECFGSNHRHVHHNSGGKMLQVASVVTTFQTLWLFASRASYSRFSSYLLLTS